MKPYDKADYKRQVRFLLMETASEDEVLDLIEKHGGILAGDDDMVRAFASHLNLVENLDMEKNKSHGIHLN